MRCTDRRSVGLRPPGASASASASRAICPRSARPAGSLSRFSTARSIWAVAEGSGRLLSATTARASQETDHASCGTEVDSAEVVTGLEALIAAEA